MVLFAFHQYEIQYAFAVFVIPFATFSASAGDDGKRKVADQISAVQIGKLEKRARERRKSRNLISAICCMRLGIDLIPTNSRSESTGGEKNAFDIH